MKLKAKFNLVLILIVTITVIIGGYVFIYFMNNTFQEEQLKEIENYGKEIQSLKVDNLETGVAAVQEERELKIIEQILKYQEYNIYIVKKNYEIVYPKGATQEQAKEAIHKSHWVGLEEGKIFKGISQDTNFSEESGRVFGIYPLTYANKELYGALIITQRKSFSIQKVTVFLTRSIVIFLAVTLIGVLIFTILVQAQVKKIKNLSIATQELSSGSYSVKLEEKGKDELADLAKSFNHLSNSLVSAQSEIERLEEERKRYFADASHEMRTPLTTIQGFVEGFQSGMIQEEQKPRALEMMKQETERLIRLIQENLNYDKIRTGNTQLDIQRIDGNQFLSDIVDQMDSKVKDSTNELIFDKKDPTIFLNIDPEKIRQVVINITTNAMQFTKNGTITYELLSKEGKTGFSISDTGIGIAKEDIPKIWERYYKVDPSRKAITGEGGLGLSIVAQIIKLHSGEIEVESELGRGTKFIFLFES